MANVSGSVLYFQKEYIIKKFGQEKLDKLIEDMDADSKEVMNGAIQSGKMYNVKVFQDMLYAMKVHLGMEEVANSSIEAANTQLKRLFGFIAKFVSAQKILEHGQWMWNRCYDEGSIEVLNFDENSVKMQVKNFKFTPVHRYGQEIFFKALIEIVLKKKVSNSVSRAVDDTTTEFFYSIKNEN